jgi:hypothetical protein
MPPATMLEQLDFIARSNARNINPPAEGCQPIHYIEGQAAAEIRRLTAENEKLRAALENARRDIYLIAPKPNSRSPLRTVAEAAAQRIEIALAVEQELNTK